MDTQTPKDENKKTSYPLDLDDFEFKAITSGLGFHHKREEKTFKKRNKVKRIEKRVLKAPPKNEINIPLREIDKRAKKYSLVK